MEILKTLKEIILSKEVLTILSGSLAGAAVTLGYHKSKASQEYKSLLHGMCKEYVMLFERCVIYYRQFYEGTVSYSTLFKSITTEGCMKFILSCNKPAIIDAICDLNARYHQILRHVEDASKYAVESNRADDEQEKMRNRKNARRAQGTAIAFLSGTAYETITKNTKILLNEAKHVINRQIIDNLIKQLDDSMKLKGDKDNEIKTQQSLLMKSVEMSRMVISTPDVKNLNQRQRKRLIMFTFMIRDLSLLQKCLIYVGNDEPKTKPEQAAKNTNIFFFLITLLSKVHEMWVFLEKNKILEELKMTKDCNLASKRKIAMDFYADNKTKSLFAFIRDKFGFHYEYQDKVDSLISQVFERLGEDEYEAWVSTKDSGNEVFRSSNSVVLYVLFDEMQRLGYQGNERELMDNIFNLALKASKILRDFSVAYITCGLSIGWEEREKLVILVPQISRIKIPSIVAG